jgi:hypothetical protein
MSMAGKLSVLLMGWRRVNATAAPQNQEMTPDKSCKLAQNF